MFLTILLWATHRTPTPGAVRDRFATFMVQHPNLEVDFVSKGGGDLDGGTGSITLNGPRKALIDVQMKSGEYKAFLRYPRSVELSFHEKTYAEFEPGASLDLLGARLADSLDPLMLDWFTLGSIAEYPWKTTSGDGGVDTLTAILHAPDAVVTLAADVDPAGRILAEHTGMVNAAGQSSHLDVAFTYRDAAVLPAELDPPAGWYELALSRPPVPLHEGDRSPSKTLRSPSGASRQLDAIAKNAVIEILDPEWAHSQFGASILRKVESSFAKAGLTVDRLDAIPGEVSPGFWSDPTGDALRALAPPGTPTFYWFGPQGRLRQAWFAASPREPNALLNDVNAALGDKGR